MSSSARGKASAAAGQLRLLCATAMPSPLVVPDLLRHLHDLVAATGYVFTWFAGDGRLEGMYCEPPLDSVAPNFLRQPEHLLAQAGYRGEHHRPHSRSGRVAEISTQPAFKRSEFYEVMCRPAGVDHGWDGFIQVGGQVRAALALWRPAGMPPVSTTEAGQLEALFPHLSRLLAAEVPADAQGAPTPVGLPAGRLLPSDERALAVVDAQGRIVHACAQARRMLWYLAHPDFRQGAAAVGGPDSHAAVTEVSRRLTALLRHEPAPVPALELRNQWGAFAVHGFLLGGPANAGEPAGASATGPLFGLQLGRRLPAEVLAVRRMAELPLSFKQKELCLCLVRGLRPPQIEAELGIKPTTQKDYLARIYAKLQIGTREALLDRLLHPPRVAQADADLLERVSAAG